MGLGFSRNKLALGCLFKDPYARFAGGKIKGRASGACKRLNDRLGEFFDSYLPWAAIFLPGILLIAAGFSVLLAPRFVLGVVSILFVVMGLLALHVAGKVVYWKKQFEKMASSLEARVVIQGRNSTASSQDSAERSPQSRITFH